MRKTFSSLQIRNFRLFFFGQLVSNTGNWLTNVAIILLVIKITHSGLDVGILAACSYGPILLLAAWAGSIVDHSNKRHFLLLTQTLEMLQSFALAALAFARHPSIYALYGLAILGGTFLAFDNPIRRSFVSEMVPENEIHNAVTLYGIIVNGSRVVGPALAGALVISIGYGWAFTIDAVSYLFVIGNVLRMRVDELHIRPITTKVRGTVRDGVKYVRSNHELFVSFVMLAVIGIFSYNFTVTLPLLVTKGLHGSTNQFTILYSVFSAGSIVGALIIAQKKLSSIYHIALGASLFGTSMIMLAISPSGWLILPIGFLVGASSLIYITATTTLIQIKTKSEMLGRVLALQTVLMFGTTPIGGPLLGGLADIAGGRTPVMISGIAALLTGFYGLYSTKRFKEA
ncbi:MAG TPA: MFS transporter [Candidatus Saccharimonadales bacterium]|nr:MFS transporter [Candidatus Saccharimonadales bacterium]